MATTIDKMDKAIDLEMRIQDIREETLKEIGKSIEDKIELLPEVRVDMSSNGMVYIGEVTSTEARVFHDGKRIHQVQLKCLKTDMLVEILMAIHASTF